MISGLHINEIMASNLTTLTDNAGEYEDWIDIYNTNHVPIDIGGLYLTDDLANLTLWRMSTLYSDSTTIAPNG